MIRLRNQQRLVIKERRQVVAEKKRGQRRRKEYEDTLAANEEVAKEAKRAKTLAENKAKELSHKSTFTPRQVSGEAGCTSIRRRGGVHAW